MPTLSTRRCRRAAALAVLAAGTLLAPAVASASATTVTLSPTSGPPSVPVKVSGAGFAAGDTIDLSLDATHAAIAVANAQGKFSNISVAIPSAEAPGAHEITATDRTSGTSAQKAYTVTAAWAQDRFDGRRQGLNPYENIISASNASSLDTEWTGATGGAIKSSPAVSGGMVFVGSDDDRLYAFPTNCATQAGTCTPKWTGLTGGTVESSPAVAGGIVFVGSSDHKLYAFKTNCGTGGKTCSPLWVGETDGVIISSPVVSGTTVYVGSNDGRVYAYKTTCATGGAACTPLWSGATNGAIASPVAVSGDVVYASSNDGMIYAFNANCATDGSTCSPLWTSTQTGNSFFGSGPVVSNNEVFATNVHADSFAFPAACGTGGATCPPIWSATVSGAPAVVSSPLVADGWLYTVDVHGDIEALGENCAASGGSCSYTPLRLTNATTTASASAANGVIYAAAGTSQTDRMRLGAFPEGCGLNGAASCTPLWTLNTGGLLESSPAISDGVVYFGSDDGKLYAASLHGESPAATVS